MSEYRTRRAVKALLYRLNHTRPKQLDQAFVGEDSAAPLLSLVYICVCIHII